ncbi:hypothetical protein V6N13_134328 [Hibiscus sabdariffa]|uniref:Uncharacterized protein n=1 Tax=Hibiscus sabdariffa TaxID=183260 RepID=A0ABR2R3V0_9ROSI
MNILKASLRLRDEGFSAEEPIHKKDENLVERMGDSFNGYHEPCFPASPSLFRQETKEIHRKIGSIHRHGCLAKLFLSSLDGNPRAQHAPPWPSPL